MWKNNVSKCVVGWVFSSSLAFGATDETSTEEMNGFAERMVRISGSDGTFCSGSFVDQDGYVLTAAHCVLNEDLDDEDYGMLAGDLTLAIAPTADEAVVDTYKAQVVRVDRHVDLALLRVTARVDGAALPAMFPSFKISTEAVRQRQGIVTLGYPHATPYLTIKEGKVAAIEKNARGSTSYLRTTVSSNQGASGGPTLDAQGRVVGVHVQIAGRTLNNAIDRSTQRIPAEWFEVMEANGTEPIVPSLPVIAASGTATFEYRGDAYHFQSGETFVYRMDGAIGHASVSCNGGYEPHVTKNDWFLIIEISEPMGSAPKARTCVLTTTPAPVVEDEDENEEEEIAP